MKENHIIVYSFQSLEDPLLKGLLLEYLIRLDNIKDITYHLISHEQNQFELKGVVRQEKIDFLKKKQIIWNPVKYRNGKFLLCKKIFNFLQTFFICVKIKFTYRPKAIIGFLPVAGAFSLILSKILHLKLVIFCYEPHSDYMADFGLWKRSSLKYKLLNALEKLQVKNADYLVLPTSHSIEYANRHNPASEKYLVPISIDTDIFQFSLQKRNEIRKNIKAGNKRVIIYTGKFGGIYYSAQDIISFFKKLYSKNCEYFLYIITPNIAEIRDSIKIEKLPFESYFVSDVVPYENLYCHVSAADIGLVAVPPLPSQKFRTPVKTGIYLACGIPYIINKGIAEDDIIAEKEGVGVVVPDLKTVNPEFLHDNITSILSENRDSLRIRCSGIAKKYRGIHNSVNALSGIVNNIFP